MQPVTDAAVRSYEIPEPCRGSFAHPILGEIVWSFSAGVIRPQSEQDELVLEAQLVPTGLATVVDESIPARIVSVGNPDDDQVESDVDESAPLSVPASDSNDQPKPGTVADLRAQLAELGLDTAGTKSDLAARLAEAQSDPADSTAPEGDA